MKETKPELMNSVGRKKIKTIFLDRSKKKKFTLPFVACLLSFCFSTILFNRHLGAMALAGSSSQSFSFEQAHRQLCSKIQALLTSQQFRRTQFSISLRWAGTGETIYEHRAHQPMIPASNMKLVTSAAAINLLGPDFEFKTRVGLSADSLIIIGSGDPLLGDRETDKRYGRQPHWLLEDIASRLLIKGINSIQDIIVDTSIFDDERVHPTWPPNLLLQRYACEVSGLNYNGNCVEISVINRQGKTLLLLEPKTNYLRLINETVATTSTENWFSVTRGATPVVLRVIGKVKSQAGPYSVSVANPALFFGTLLKEHLIKKGIKVEGEVKEETFSTERDFDLLAEYRTPLLDVLRRVNKDSFGLAAEALMKILGTLENPEMNRGSWESGRRVISRFLLNLGLPETEFFIADGSGLSRENRLSGYVISSLLHWLYRQPFWPTFESTLAIGGIDGTLESVFRETHLRGRVVAKTGYINGVRALSGIAHTKSGDIIFSFLANNASNSARIFINTVVKELTHWADSLLASTSVPSSNK